jgi:hypothetical protein
VKLIVNTYAHDEIDGYDYAFLDITPELANVIIKRREALKQLFSHDSEACQIEYYDFGPVFSYSLPESIESLMDNGEDFKETDACAEDFEDLAERTECDRMVITSSDVYWTCYAKHTDVRIETRPIPYDVIETVALGQPETTVNA